MKNTIKQKEKRKPKLWPYGLMLAVGFYALASWADYKNQTRLPEFETAVIETNSGKYRKAKFSLGWQKQQYTISDLCKKIENLRQPDAKYRDMSLGRTGQSEPTLIDQLSDFKVTLTNNFYSEKEIPEFCAICRQDTSKSTFKEIKEKTLIQKMYSSLAWPKHFYEFLENK